MRRRYTITIGDITDTLTGHARRAGHCPRTVAARVAKGMDVQQALIQRPADPSYHGRRNGIRNSKNPGHPWRRHNPYR